MATEFGGQGEEQERRLQENVSAEEYTNALDRLRAFATDETASKIGQLHTLEELADMTAGIGSALRAVALSKGTFTPGDNAPWKTPEGNKLSWKPLMYELRGTTETTEVGLTLTELIRKEDDFVVVQTRSLPVNEQKYPLRLVCLPSQKMLNAEGHRMLNSLVTAHEGAGVPYHPREHPQDAHVQQNFARVLHQSVNDVLSLNLPPPQDIPAAFYT